MPLELDHIFICTAAGAPEANLLVHFGLTEGTPNQHPGQGTACRRFFFRNAYLELLWVEYTAEAQSNLVRRTGLWERWSRRGRGASPFGVCFRPVEQGQEDVPFSSWEYRPPYLPEPLVIHMGTNSERAAEPLLFYFPLVRRPDSAEASRRQPLEHAAGLREITRIRISLLPDDAASSLLRTVEEQCPSLSFAVANDDLLEIGFDGESAGRSVDFRPTLPLIFRW
jgi:hypothetical protein